MVDWPLAWHALCEPCMPLGSAIEGETVSMASKNLLRLALSSPARRNAMRVGMAGALAAPAIVHAQSGFSWKMTSAYANGAPFGMVAMPCGNTGVQMTGWFKKEIKSSADLKGLKMRIPGLAGRVYAQLGVDVKLLPGGEIFPALERGVIDAAEFVGPFQDRKLGLPKAAKFYHTTGWHQTATVSQLLINKAPL